MNKTLIAAFAVAALASQSSAAGIQLWTVGTFIPSGISGSGNLVVGNGASVGYWDTSVSGGALTFVGGNSTGRVQASNDGTRFGGTSLAVDSFTSNNYNQMSIYSIAGGAWTSYGNLGYHSGTTASSGWGLSGDGNTVVGQAYYNTTAVGGTAARVNPTVGTIPGGPPVNLHPNTTNNGRVQASNFDGTVVGGFAVGTAPGAIWVNGVEKLMQTDLGSGTVNLGSIEDISDNGRFALGDGSSATSGSFYIYDRIADTYTFGPNPYLANSEIATMASISSDGRYVGGRYLRSGLSPYVDAKAFRYDTATNTFATLDDLADAAGINRQGFHLGTITGMSDDGMKFVGIGGLLTAPTTTSFYIDLTPVPEPGTLALAGLGAAALIRRKRKA